MKKTIGAILIATLMGSLSANATLVFSDDFSVAGGVGAINDGIGTTRQTSGTTTSTYTYGGLGTASIVNDFANGGTAQILGTYGDGDGATLTLDTNFGPQLSGTDWDLSFTAYSPVVGGTLNNGWFGFGVGTSSFPGGAPFGEFGIIIRPTGDVAIFQNGGFLVANVAAYNPFSSIIRYHLLIDEINNDVTLGYDAFDTGLNYLDSEILGIIPATFVAGDRTLNWAVNADDAVNAQISTYIEDVTINAIPEPTTFGLFAALGGGMLFIRRRFRR